MSLNRRAFLKQATATAAALGAAHLAPAIATSDSPGQTDLVPLLIETDRDQLLERLVGVVPAEHTEPTLRSLVLALVNHEGEPNPSDGDLSPDRPWRRNQVLANQLKADREREGDDGNGSVAEILEVRREESEEEASRAVLAGLEHSVPEQQLWSAVFLAAGDLMLKQSGIISVHANTSVNALHYASRQARDSKTRQLLLLQAAAFLPLFRDLLGGGRRPLRIDTLEALDQDEDQGSALEDIFAAASVDRVEAARKTLEYLAAGGAEPPFMRLARQYVVDRNTGYHDYKFAEAAFENAAAMESPWRERYLAASVLYLNGSSDKVNTTVRQARSLLG